MNAESLPQGYEICMHGVGMRKAITNGCIEATGEDFLDLINRISTNDVEHLLVGSGTSTVLTTEKGRIIDVLALSKTDYSCLILTGSSDNQIIIDWIDKYVFMEKVTLRSLSDQFLLLNLLGPLATKIIEEISGKNLGTLEPFANDLITIAEKNVRVIRGNMGVVQSYFLLIPMDIASSLSKILISAGASWISEESWELLRIENEIPVFGKEITEQYNPLEVGLERIIDFNKGCYIGQEVIARLDTYNKVQKRLVFLAIDDLSCSGSERPLYLDGKVVGQITSAAKLPNGLKYIGLGFVRVAALVGRNSFTLTADGQGIARVTNR
ncbi:hypothetical protein FIM04_01725 [SAR202 cluster bacterium AC-409-J13_OGT_754m]|nr:hypothetical protein [SAR202 cluster bacterium AC-409-J13_OGT_754m]